MKPKVFIEDVIIPEFRDIVFRHPYLSFAMISIGIEFLGKCMLVEKKTWYIKPEIAFKKGKELLSSIDSNYLTVNLWDLRNGFAHTLLPQKVLLSEVRHGIKHFDKDSSGKVVLVAEIFYRDFVIACQKVLETEFGLEDKMNKDILKVGP